MLESKALLMFSGGAHLRAQVGELAAARGGGDSGSDGADQFAGVERFRKKIAGAVDHGLANQLAFLVGADHDDRQRRILFGQPAQQFIAVAVGQLIVEQDAGQALAGRGIEQAARGEQVGGGDDIAEGLERSLDETHHDGIVVDREYAVARHIFLIGRTPIRDSAADVR